MRAQRVKIQTEAGPTSGIWQASAKPVAALVLAHGAGGDMETPFLASFATELADGGIGVLRFNFLYKEQGRKAPDPAGKLEAVLLGAFKAAGSKAKDIPIFAGGKSLGGRIASQCVAKGMPAAGLVFLGYPLHAPATPEKVRDAHLADIAVPMLFIEGTRDPFATPGPLKKTMKMLDNKTTELVKIEGGDHSFRVKGKQVEDSIIGASLADFAIGFMRRRG